MRLQSSIPYRLPHEITLPSGATATVREGDYIFYDVDGQPTRVDSYIGSWMATTYQVRDGLMVRVA